MSAVAQRQADKRSLGFQFKQQLMELVKLIESGKAHYVRCAPPTHTQAPTPAFAAPTAAPARARDVRRARPATPGARRKPLRFAPDESSESR